MDSILQSIETLEGVNGVFVADETGQLLGFRAHPVYDANLLQQASKLVAAAVDSVKLIQSDWNTITGQFTEGRLIVRSVGSTSRAAMLVVIADNRINLSFAGVAMRVALGKLKALIDNNLGASSAALRGIDVAPPPPSALSGSIAQTSGPSTAGGFSTVSHQPPASRLPHSEIANSGLTWSGVSGSSSVSGSAVYVTDPASAEFLTICTKVLARSVGPMAKLYVRDAVRKLCAGKPFSRDISEELMTELVQQIKKPADAAQFRNLVLKSL